LAPGAAVSTWLRNLGKWHAKLVTIEAMLGSPDQQVSLPDPNSRSMPTSGRRSGVVGYNVQVAVDTAHHLIVAHEVTNNASDRAQLANMVLAMLVSLTRQSRSDGRQRGDGMLPLPSSSRLPQPWKGRWVPHQHPPTAAPVRHTP
jgi:hypothetical protein